MREGVTPLLRNSRLVLREVEPVAALLHLGPVQRTVPGLGSDTTASRALPGPVVGPVAEEQQLDAPVRSRLERLRPAGSRAAVAPRRLTPALDRGRLLLGSPALEQRLDGPQQLRWIRVRLGGSPADDRLLDLARELLLELGARLLAGHDNHARPPQPTHRPLQRRRHVFEVILDELFDVPLVARLRPAALVVPPVLLVELVRQLLEPAAAQPVEIPPLAPHERDEHP